MRAVKTPPPGGNRAGGQIQCFERIKHSVDDIQINILATERRFLQLGWFDPVRLHDLGYLLGMKPADFSIPAYEWLFGYLAATADAGRNPSVTEALQLARRECVELTQQDLDDVLFGEMAVDADFDDYGSQIVGHANERQTEFLRELCRDGIRAIRRGLEAEARLHQRRFRRHADRNRPARRKAVTYV